jgi:hypothetical protein
MLLRSWPILAAALLAAAAAASAQMPPAEPSTDPAPGVAGPPPSAPSGPRPREESAQQNVRESEQYEKLLCSNPAFLKTRVQKECGPITDPQLHQQCLDSFKCGEQPRVHPRRTPPSER